MSPSYFPLIERTNITPQVKFMKQDTCVWKGISYIIIPLQFFHLVRESLLSCFHNNEVIHQKHLLWHEHSFYLQCYITNIICYNCFWKVYILVHVLNSILTSRLHDFLQHLTSLAKAWAITKFPSYSPILVYSNRECGKYLSLSYLDSS